MALDIIQQILSPPLAHMELLNSIIIHPSLIPFRCHFITFIGSPITQNNKKELRPKNSWNYGSKRTSILFIDFIRRLFVPNHRVRCISGWHPYARSLHHPQPAVVESLPVHSEEELRMPLLVVIWLFFRTLGINIISSTQPQTPAERTQTETNCHFWWSLRNPMEEININ